VSGIVKKCRETIYNKSMLTNFIIEAIEKLESSCPVIKLTQEIIDTVNKFNSAEELLRAGGLSIDELDKAAFGFTAESIKTLMPEQLKIKWKLDMRNVRLEIIDFCEKNGYSIPKGTKIWANNINLTEPIEVSYEKNGFYIEDGHHRFFAAKVRNKPLNVVLEIKQNPITALSGLEYDDFHRCIFSQVKGNKNTIY